MSAYTVTRPIELDECRWLPAPLTEGEVVYKFTGWTYGVIGSGIACTKAPDGKAGPFFEVPRDALAVTDD